MTALHFAIVLFSGLLFCHQETDKKPQDAFLPRKVIFADTSVMYHSLQQIRTGDPGYVQALAALRKAADEVLLRKPTSVMDKTQVPPSGDKHDYMSQGPYWWADPSKPGGLPYIRRDGEVNPEAGGFSDHKNMGKLFQDTDLLGKAWYFTGDAKYAKKAVEMIRTWFLDEATRMNPHLNYGQAIPGINTGRGIGIIETRGLSRLPDAIALIQSSGEWTAEDESGMQAWCRAYLDWLRTSQHGKDEAVHPNNHGTWYDVQVCALALYTSQPEIAREIAELAKTRRLEAHISADGGQPEELARTRAWSYSCMNLWGLMQLARAGAAVGVDLWFYPETGKSLIPRALDYLLPYVDAPATWPHQQITEFRPEALLPQLRQASGIYLDSFYGAAAADLGRRLEDDYAVLWE
ncbi:MAG: alginate lyase family protein [Bacteroidia bacterium]